jgi:uncharacterized membrane protein YhfC
MLHAAFILTIVLELALPIGIMLWLKRRFNTTWGLFGVGVITFIASQVVHIPLLLAVQQVFKPYLPPYVLTLSAYLLNALILGLLAGICEETARWTGYRMLRERGNSFDSALALGTGHGGVECMLVGLAVAYQYLLPLYVQQTQQTFAGVTPQAAAALFALPWYMPLVSLFERMTAVSMHISLSVLVWLAVSRRAWMWFAAAVLYHTFLDGLTVALISLGVSTYTVEAILGVVMVINLACLYWFGLRQKVSLSATIGTPTQ